ncbi:hypothetical protein LMIY3S_03535 [Labrys miyagiensis]
MDIQENMEVVDANDQHVGFVERMEGGRIRLKAEEAIDPEELLLDLSQVAAIEGNKVRLAQRVSAVTTRTFLSRE